ncbi:TPA: AAA family ATPase [Pseudomonas aeruginosa]|nr:AAA family ATPase [Pseudomonas aeruginosa]
MTQNTSIFPYEFSAPAKASMYEGNSPLIRISAGLTVLIGPNGSGKTQILRAINSALRGVLNNGVRYLAAGRASPFEHFRSSSSTPGHWDQSPAYIGNSVYMPQWNDFESLTGDYLALSMKNDLRLKVQARLQDFLSRTLELKWSQQGLVIHLRPLDGGEPYPANVEASGILQLAPLLAAIYNPDVSALIIDEPEISLHPQYQAFILQELQKVSGDPSLDATKKIVVIATHSPSSLPFRSSVDLPKMIFFSDKNTLPVQVEEGSEVLRNRRLITLISRLTATHKLAFFAKNVLLVEGPSDEIIISQLALRLSHPLLPANTQIVPVNGKGEMVDAVKMFELIGKRVFILADLDAFTDSNDLVNKVSEREGANLAAAQNGHASLMDFDRRVREAFSGAVDRYWDIIESLVTAHPYWAACRQATPDNQVKRRATVAFLMSNGSEELDAAVGSSVFGVVRLQLHSFLQALEGCGCFILGKGTVEDYYIAAADRGSKIEAAVAEASVMAEAGDDVVRENYSDLIRALKASAPLEKVDENKLLRESLGAALGAIFQTADLSTSSEELNSRARSINSNAEIFRLENCSRDDVLAIRVHINSPLFQRSNFPIEISTEDNLSRIIRDSLPNT